MKKKKYETFLAYVKEVTHRDKKEYVLCKEEESSNLENWDLIVVGDKVTQLSSFNPVGLILNEIELEEEETIYYKVLATTYGGSPLPFPFHILFSNALHTYHPNVCIGAMSDAKLNVVLIPKKINYEKVLKNNSIGDLLKLIVNLEVAVL